MDRPFLGFGVRLEKEIPGIPFAWHLQCFEMRRESGQKWLGRRDSNPDTQIQSLQSYR